MPDLAATIEDWWRRAVRVLVVDEGREHGAAPLRLEQGFASRAASQRSFFRIVRCLGVDYRWILPTEKVINGYLNFLPS